MWYKIRRIYVIATLFYVLDIVYLGLSLHFTEVRASTLFQNLSIAQGILVALVVTVKAVQRSGPFPAWALVLHVASTTALFVIDFAWVYWARSPQPHACMNIALTKADSIYFTLTTLTTVGYGDIAPVTETCREIVSAQMIGGVILLVIILSLLISRIAELGNPLWGRAWAPETPPRPADASSNKPDQGTATDDQAGQ